ncbi:UDP-glucose dehydrogenase family protein [Cellulosimicrobium cellulans]|uniref:UDP-glucose dehydrogenase family protein n=1 Tax=Cellulosimicrobium cellulans TaxID=1710 RepID=UPI00084965E0|nr:UDP-glucose/GDP-mannose dehydrogenase family protein [Cellulosimicrobium cellulans]
MSTTDTPTTASGETARPRATVVGTGYLGATHAACLAELGYDVLGLDTDPAKVEALGRGEVPFYEPGLAELVERHTASGRLRFTTSAAEAAAFADVHFVCVGTPQRRDSMAADTSHVVAAVRALVPGLRHDALLVGKSTVPVGTARALQDLATSLAPEGVEVGVAWNPEFLREGRAVEDTLRPDRLVVGVTDPRHEKVLRELYRPLVDAGVPFLVTDLATAELVKVSANAFLATKISFANAVAELCEAAGGDVVALTEAIGHDPRIGHQFLSAGLGFGGGCLPKDIRALMARAGELGVDEALTFLREVDAINMRRRSRTVALAVEECGGSVLGRRIAVLGAAFKPGTDDVRDSPALNVAAQLQLQGAHVRVYDPQAARTAARTFPTLGYATSVEEAVTDADLVLHLTEWDEFAALDPAALRPARRVVVDGRNALDRERWTAAGWRYRALGRAVVGAA